MYCVSSRRSQRLARSGLVTHFPLPVQQNKAQSWARHIQPVRAASTNCFETRTGGGGLLLRRRHNHWTGTHPPTGQTSKPNFWDLNPLAPPNPIFYPKTIQQKPQTVKHLNSIERNSSYLVSCDTYNLGPMFQAKPHPQTLTRFQMWNPCKAPTPSPPRITTQQEWAGFWRMWNVYGPFRIYSSRKWWAGGSLDEKELGSHIESGGWLALLRKPRDSLAPVELVEPMDVGEDALKN